MRTTAIYGHRRVYFGAFLGSILFGVPALLLALATAAPCTLPSWCPFDWDFCWIYATCDFTGGGGSTPAPTKECQQCFTKCKNEYAANRAICGTMACLELWQSELEACETNCVADFSC